MIKGWTFNSLEVAEDFCATLHNSLKDNPAYNAKRYAVPKKHPERSEWFVPYLDRYPMPDGWIEIDKDEWFPQIDL